MKTYLHASFYSDVDGGIFQTLYRSEMMRSDKFLPHVSTMMRSDKCLPHVSKMMRSDKCLPHVSKIMLSDLSERIISLRYNVWKIPPFYLKCI
jgi:hypothetical protein